MHVAGRGVGLTARTTFYRKFAATELEPADTSLRWQWNFTSRKAVAMLGTILIIVLILLLIGALPTWPHSAGWGYYPGGGLGLILVIVIILVLMGRV